MSCLRCGNIKHISSVVRQTRGLSPSQQQWDGSGQRLVCLCPPCPQEQPCRGSSAPASAQVYLTQGFVFCVTSVIFIALFASDSESKKYIVLLKAKGLFDFLLSSTGSRVCSRPVCCSNMETFRGLARVQERIPMMCSALGGPYFSHCSSHRRKSIENRMKPDCSILLI